VLSSGHGSRIVANASCRRPAGSAPFTTLLQGLSPAVRTRCVDDVFLRRAVSTGGRRLPTVPLPPKKIS